MFLAVSTRSPICVEKRNEEALLEHVMAENLQLEVQSYMFAADWNSLERIAQLFKNECEGK